MDLDSVRDDAAVTNPLMHLALLSNQAETLLAVQQYKHRVDTELSNLKQEVESLSFQRSKLEAEINELTQRHVGQVIKEKYASQVTDDKKKVSKSSADILRSARIRELYNKQIAYRLTGRTVFYPKEDEIGIRFETFHSGKFFECRYIFLKVDPLTKKESVWRHTIPSFIPLKQLENEYLEKDKIEFLDIVDDYLSAFVRRREQAKAVETMPNIQDFMSNMAFNYIQFTVKTHTLTNVYLVYDNLKASLPTRVLILEKPTEDEIFDPANGIRLKSDEPVFKTKPLNDATLLLVASSNNRQ